MEEKTFVLTGNDADRRIDRVIRKFLTEVPLPKIYEAIRKGLIRLNGKRVSVNTKTAAGDILSIAAPLIPAGRGNAARPAVKEQLIHHSTVQTVTDIPVLLRTKDLLIINKPAGIAVHGQRSVAAQLAALLAPSGTDAGISFSPGPLHRLDKNTTGVLCFSRTLTGAQWFSRCLQEKTAGKYYLGAVCGNMSARTIQTGAAGNQSITHCVPLAYNSTVNASLMLFRLVTGKKHQIRIHTQYAGHPLAGDTRYGGKEPLPQCGQYVLHAWRLYFPAGRLTGLPACIEAPLFPEAARCLARFFPDWEHEAAHLVYTHILTRTSKL